MRYFAYGSNMDPTQMEVRCPGAQPLGVARLDAYRLAFTFDSVSWEGGVATVVPDSADTVWGVCWEITDEHAATLDVYEGVEQGVYRRILEPVLRDGTWETVMLYRTLDDTPRTPSAAYMAGLVRGAEAFGLPAAYRDRLAVVPTLPATPPA